MVYLNLHLTSNDKIFEYYSLPKKILEKKYEIALIKLDGEINNSNSGFVDENNNFITEKK
jgi:hypothetical protein